MTSEAGPDATLSTPLDVELPSNALAPGGETPTMATSDGSSRRKLAAVAVAMAVAAVANAVAFLEGDSDVSTGVAVVVFAVVATVMAWRLYRRGRGDAE